METLQQIYYTPAEPSSFSGISNLRNAFQKKTNSSLKLKTLKKWLQGQNVYTLHKPARKNYARNKIRVAGIDDQWQADLVDMRAYSKYNYGYKYILTVIDVFSKYAWAVPLISKTGEELVKALLSIFSCGREPLKLNTDQGTEFENRKVKTFLKEKNIHFFTTRSDKKAAVVERFNRTLKNKMWRYFTHSNTYRFTDVLGDFIQSYNNTYHRSIKMAPANVNYDNETKVYIALYGTSNAKLPVKYNFAIGDTVRVSKYKSAFEKGYLPNWSEELFTVCKRYPRQPPVYQILDYAGDIIEGTFYEPELQKVTKNDQTYIIEKIVERKKAKNGNMLVLVKWRGYPSNMNTWVAEKDIIHV